MEVDYRQSVCFQRNEKSPLLTQRAFFANATAEYMQRD